MTASIRRIATPGAAIEGRTIVGVAVPYGQRITVQDSKFGVCIEEMRRGVFARSLEQRGHKVRLLDHHRADTFPLGRLVEYQDLDDGLHVAFEIANTARGDEALELVKSGALDSLSVGFSPIEDVRIGRDPKRNLPVIARTEAALREVSLVNFPAFSKAQIVGTRSSVIDLSRYRKLIA